jgi:hypothetical protein
MATFDWIPYLEGKYMTYYQIGALVFSAICLFFALLSLVVYLVTSKITTQQLMARGQTAPLVASLHVLSYISVFVWLAFVPMVCQALDVLNIF